MWSKLDDGLIDHPKVSIAGALLGPNGVAVAIGFYAVCLMWTNKHLTDGFIPTEVVANFHHVERPLVVADALTKAGLLEPVLGGVRIHDFGDYNATADTIKKKRKEDRDRKRAALSA